MKTLQEIKEEYATRNGQETWDNLCERARKMYRGSISPYIAYEDIIQDYAKEVAKTALLDASKLATLNDYHKKTGGSIECEKFETKDKIITVNRESILRVTLRLTI